MKLFYLIFLLSAFFSCSKKQETLVEQHIPKAQETMQDSVNEAVITKDTLGNLAPHETKCIKEFVTSYKFNAFKVKMYTGKLADPNFEGNPYAADKEYVEFIIKGCEKGINFNGKYTLIHMSCGCMCEHLLVVDRSNGEIFNGVGIELSNGDGRFGYAYNKNSKMIIADSGLFTDDSFTHYTCYYKTAPEIYVWQSKGFKKL